MELFVIGVILAIVGNLGIAFSLTLQKSVHNKAEAAGVPATCTNSQLGLAIAGMMAGEIFNFVAFGLASPTVISPMGAFSVVANAIFATLILHETMTQRNVMGIVLCVLGSVVVVANAPPTVEGLPIDALVELLEAPASIAYLVVLLVAVGLLYAAEPRYGKTLLLIDLMLCSLLGSITVLCSSTLSKLIGQLLGGNAALLSEPLPYLLPLLMAVTIVLQLKHLNSAMEHFESTQVVPVYYITFTLCSIAGGGIVYQDFWRFTLGNALGFFAGCVLCFWGVLLIAMQGSHAPKTAQPPGTSSKQKNSRRGPPAPPRPALSKHSSSLVMIQRSAECMVGCEHHLDRKFSLRLQLEPVLSGSTTRGSSSSSIDTNAVDESARDAVPEHVTGMVPGGLLLRRAASGPIRYSSRPAAAKGEVLL